MGNNYMGTTGSIGLYYYEDPTAVMYKQSVLESMREQEERRKEEELQRINDEKATNTNKAISTDIVNKKENKIKEELIKTRKKEENANNMNKAINDDLLRMKEKQKKQREEAELKRIKETEAELKNYKYKTYYNLCTNGNFIAVKTMYIFNPSSGKTEFSYNYPRLNVDPYNYSRNSDYPLNFPLKRKGDVIAVSTTSVLLYSYAYYLRILNTSIYEFNDSLKNVKNNNEKNGEIICRMEVEILETKTHVRTNNKKTKYYVMCKVKVLVSVINAIIISQKPEMANMIGKIGYIWQTFGSETEITKEPALSLLYCTNGFIDKITADLSYGFYYNYIDGIHFSFSSCGSSARSNNTNRLIELKKHPMITVLIKVAKAVGVIGLSVGHINYNEIGSGGSHGQGKAIDVWKLYGKGGTCYDYRRDYNLKSKTPVLDEEEEWEWNIIYQPDIIAKFEAAFMKEPESLQILGPWKMNYKNVRTGEVYNPVDNYIYTYPQLGKLSKTYYVHQAEKREKKINEKNPNYVVRTKDQLGEEYSNVYYESEKFFDKLDDIIDEIKESGKLIPELQKLSDDMLKKTLHWAIQHHHHGHYAVK